jgi:cytochrome c oxidase assembly protein subunit 15
MITTFALFALVAIVITGAAVRLTGSGLGCTDWPNCTDGKLVAPLEFHPMVEFVNRLFTGVVSFAVVFAVLGSLVRVPRRRDLVWLSLGLVAGVIGQIVLGGLTVLFELRPPFVMGHFLLSAVLVANAVVLVHRAGEPVGPAVPIASLAVRRLSWAMVVTAGLVLVSGTVVTSTGPHGGDENAPRFGFDITEVARLHSVTVWVFLALSVACLALLARTGASATVNRRGRGLVVAIVAQGALGYVQYALSVPPALVLAHVAGSIAVWIAALWFHLGLWTRAEQVEPVDSVDHPRAPAMIEG